MAKPKIDISHAAKLANITLTSQESKAFEKQLNSILHYISKLQEVNTAKVQSVAHITSLTNVTRLDKTAPSLSQKAALSNAAKVYSGFFEVNAIFEEQ